MEKIKNLGIQPVETYIPDETGEELCYYTKPIDVKAIYDGRLHTIIGIDDKNKPVAMYYNGNNKAYKYLIYPEEIELEEMYEYSFKDNAEIPNYQEAIDLFKSLLKSSKQSIN